jgi:hypothetical protein
MGLHAVFFGLIFPHARRVDVAAGFLRPGAAAGHQPYG